MQAGTLDRRVTIQQQVTTRDAYGAEVVQWLNLVTLWANKREAVGLEAFQADQVAQATASATFRIRYRSGLQAKMRLEDDQGALWDIEGVAEIGRRDGLELRCSRVMA